MPETYQKYIEAIDWYVEHIKNDRAPDLKYAAAVITLRYRNWPDARQRLGADHRAVLRDEVRRRLQGLRRHPSDVLHRLQREDEEAKDCALGKLLARRRAVRRVGRAARRRRRSPTWTASRRSSRR